mmetsp:Transcript_23249/g.55640  ORF Transcript_23249/g.55640 Transcript_23249/m.55640 type:complete len:273 (+) Transcript_23249:288-1106(+)
MMLAGKVLEVVNVLLHEDRDVDLHARQVAVLALTERLGVHHRPPQLRLTQDLLHPDADRAIGQQDGVARRDALAELRIAQPDARLGLRLVALKLGVPVADGLHHDGLPGLEVDRLVLPQHGGADLRALGVQKAGNWAGFFRCHLPEALKDREVGRMVSVAEVQPRHIHARINQLTNHILAPALRAHGANNFGFPVCVPVLLGVQERIETNLCRSIEEDSGAWEAGRGSRNPLAVRLAHNSCAEYQALRIGVPCPLRSASDEDDLIAVLDGGT